MTGNDGVEVPSGIEDSIESPSPIDDASVGGIIYERRHGDGGAGCAYGEQIAGVNQSLRGEVNNRVAVGMTAAEITGANFLAAQEHFGFVSKRDARNAGHFSRHHIGAGVLMP